MIILVTDYFDKYDRNNIKTGEKELLVSHGYDTETGNTVVLQCVPPHEIGKYSIDLNEWVLNTKP